MKENFDKCLEMLLKHEGGFTADTRDRGNQIGDGHGNQGSTMLGVTSKVYADWTGKPAPIELMKTLTQEDVAPIYKKNYWDKCKCDDPRVNSGLDYVLFDWAVNSGVSRASKAIQKICGASPDGVIGNQTLSMIEKQDPKYMIEEFAVIRQGFYESLSSFKTYGNGWTRRNKEATEKALSMAS